MTIGHRCRLDPRQLGGGRGRDAGEQPRRRRGRRRQHHLVGEQLLGGDRGADHEREALRRTAELADHGSRADVEPCRQRDGDAAEAAFHAHEGRSVREPPGLVAPATTNDSSPLHATSCGTVARADSRRAWPAYTPPSSGSTSRSTTSSPSLVATSSPTEMSSSSASGRPGDSCAEPLEPGVAQHTGGGDLLDVRGHPHHRSRQRPQLAPGPDRGGGGGGVSLGQPELRHQVHAFGPARQHRLGADIDAHPRDLAGHQLAADVRRALQHQHVTARRGQHPGGGQAGDAAAHDDARVDRSQAWANSRTRAHRRESRPRNQLAAGPVCHLCAPDCSPPRFTLAALAALTACSGGGVGRPVRRLHRRRQAGGRWRRRS